LWSTSPVLASPVIVPHSWNVSVVQITTTSVTSVPPTVPVPLATVQVWVTPAGLVATVTL
jgi:hypothetical protein